MIDDIMKEAGLVVTIDPKKLEQENFLERLIYAAKQLYAAGKGELPAELTLRFKIAPGGVMILQYAASIGETGPHLTWIYTMGETPEQVVKDAIHQLNERDLVNEIRVFKLRELAKALGYSVVKRVRHTTEVTS